MSYLSKTICEELIELMSQEVRSAILDEIKAAGYFSLSVDSTPDLSHIDQLCVIMRYVSPFDNLPVERFLTFLELKSHVGKEMADAVLNFLIEDCNIDFSKCRGQSYDNAANMSGIYKGMQSVILQLNPYAIYIACAAHSLNLVGRSAVDCCLEAVNFFSLVQTLYVFFSASTHRWKVLKDHIKDEKVLKKLSNTRWEAHAVATDAILNSYSQILDALDSISEDRDQKGETRQEAMNIANKMQEFEFVFMVTMWNDILQQFHRTSQALQSSELNLQVCADLYKTLTIYLQNLRERFEEFENKSKEILPDGDYRGNSNRRRTRRVQVNDGPAEDAVLSARDKFRISTFYFIVDILQVEMKTRGDVYQNLAEKFSFLLNMNLTNDEVHSKVKSLVASYPEDLNSNLSDELQQFHQYVRLKMEKDKNISANFTDFYNIIVNDQLQTVFPNVEICFRIFLSLMITNCSGERSFSQLKRIKNPLRTTMRQDRLSSLALLSIESDVTRRMNFDNLIEEFARQKCRKKKV